MQDYFSYGKPECLPEYLLHALLVALQTYSEYFDSSFVHEFQQYLAQSNRNTGVSSMSIARPTLYQIEASSDNLLEGELE